MMMMALNQAVKTIRSINITVAPIFLVKILLLHVLKVPITGRWLCIRTRVSKTGSKTHLHAGCSQSFLNYDVLVTLWLLTHVPWLLACDLDIAAGSCESKSKRVKSRLISEKEI